MKRTLFQLVFLALCAAPVFAQNPPRDEKAARMDEIFAQFDKPTSPGCALAVMKDGQIVYKRGYGMADLDHDIPIKPDTVFHVASVSKQFTALAILLLAQQGKLALDDEVRKYIPELPDFGQKLTIRHLLHHTSGLRDQWTLLLAAGWRWSEDVVRDADILDLVSKMKALNFKPGDQHLYCNTGYTLAAWIVNKVSGQSLREFCEANIFKPLGMTSTFFRDDHAVTVKRMAYGYRGAANDTFKLNVPNYDTVGASSLLTTVEDLAHWEENFYTKRVGGAALIEQLQTPGALNDGERINYALGLVVAQYRGLKLIEHSGGDAGYRSHLLRFPGQHFSVACLCNTGTNPGQFARRVADIYLANQLAPEPPKPEPPKTAQLPEPEISNNVGVYWNAWTEELAKVTASDGKLNLSTPGYSNELPPLGDNRFLLIGQPPGEAVFERTSNGTAQRLTLKPAGSKPLVFEMMPPANPTAAQLAEYEGDYYSDEIDATFRVKLQEGKLILLRKKYDPMPLQPVFRDGFTTFSILGHVRFTRDAQNRINGLTLSAGRIRGFRFVKK